MMGDWAISKLPATSTAVAKSVVKGVLYFQQMMMPQSSRSRSNLVKVNMVGKYL